MYVNSSSLRTGAVEADWKYQILLLLNKGAATYCWYPPC